MVMTTEMSIGMGGQLLGQLVWYVFCNIWQKRQMCQVANWKKKKKKSYSTFYLGSENLQGNCLAWCPSCWW